MVRGKPSPASGYRLALGGVGLVFTALLTAAPLMSSTTSASRGELRESSVKQAGDADKLETIRGSMTLQQVADASGVPLEQIIEALALPPDVDATDGAGRLLRRYNLQMSNLRDAISHLRSSQPTPAAK